MQHYSPLLRAKIVQIQTIQSQSPDVPLKAVPVVVIAATHVNVLVQVMMMIAKRLVLGVMMLASHADAQLQQALRLHVQTHRTVSLAVLTGMALLTILNAQVHANAPLHVKTHRPVSLPVLPGMALLAILLAQDHAAQEVVVAAAADQELILISIFMMLRLFKTIRTKRRLYLEQYVLPQDQNAQLKETCATVEPSPTQIQLHLIIFQSLIPSLKKCPKPDTA